MPLARAQITQEMVAAEARKLLPHPRVSAVPTPFSLVNIESPLWIATKPDITLGTVTLLGHRVTLRAHLETVDWDFGDGGTDTTHDPGTAYTDDNPCDTVDCPQYYGHTYRHTGVKTVTATLTWTGQFQVDGGAWQNITQPVSAPATSLDITIKEARGVLVPN